MYLDHFRFVREPFSIAPDPGFLYLSEGHNEALAHLQYGLNHGGFVLITGEVGTGKTTLLRNLTRMTPENMDLAFILNPRLTAQELIETICDALAIQHDKSATQSIKKYIDLLNAYLLTAHRQGRSTVLVIDEAQNLSPAVLEQIRLLTNLETDERKLLRIILIGQPELDALLARTELRQLSQRITARYRLGPLRSAETSAYVAHRLATAGGNPRLFTPAALRQLHRLTTGIPRLINVVADRALLGAFAEGKTEVSGRIVRKAAAEVVPTTGRLDRIALIAAAGLALVTLIMIGVWLTARKDRVTEHVVPAGGPTVVVTAQDVERPVAQDKVAQDRNGATGDIALPSAVTTGTAISRGGLSVEQLKAGAFKQVLGTWGVDLSIDGQEQPCDFALTNQLLCTSQQGTLDDIRRLDVPVVLELWDDESVPYHAALLGLVGNDMYVGLGSTTISADVERLKDIWFGSYTIVWRPPAGYDGPLQEGDRKEGVVLLRKQLQDALGRPIPSTIETLFDIELARALAEYQRRQSLPADRSVGPLTWISLARLSNEGTMPGLNTYRPPGVQ